MQYIIACLYNMQNINCGETASKLKFKIIYNDKCKNQNNNI